MTDPVRPADGMSSRGRIGRYLAARWRGEIPLRILFWRDMLLIATAVSVVSTLLAVALLAAGQPMILAMAAHFATLPYNVFLFLAVWRTSGLAGGWSAQMAPLGAAIWLAVATLV